MLTCHIPAAQYRKPDIARSSRPGLAFAYHIGNTVQIDLPASGGGFTKCQRRTRWCVNFVMVMRFQNFDIPASCQFRGDLFDKLGQQCHTD